MLVKTERCESCDAVYGENHRITTAKPSKESLAAMLLGTLPERATDGCVILSASTPRCEHGHSSWLITARELTN